MPNFLAFREKTFASLFCIILIFAIIFVPFSYAWASPISRYSIMELTNEQRAKAGVAPLSADYELTIAAQNKANDMLENGYWEHYHNSKSPWDWMNEASYKFSSAGENLAIDFSDVDGLVDAWMGSASHRQNLLNPIFEDIGIGIAQGQFQDHETIIVVQMFGKPQIEPIASKSSNQQAVNSEPEKKVDDLYQSQQNEGILEKTVQKIKRFTYFIYDRAKQILNS